MNFLRFREFHCIAVPPRGAPQELNMCDTSFCKCDCRPIVLWIWMQDNCNSTECCCRKLQWNQTSMITPWTDWKNKFYAQNLILVPLIVVPGIFFKTVFSSFFGPRSSDLDENSAKLQEITPRSCLDRSGPSKTTENIQKNRKTNF